MVTSSVTSSPPAPAWSGHFTLHSGAAKSCTPDTGSDRELTVGFVRSTLRKFFRSSKVGKEQNDEDCAISPSCWTVADYSRRGSSRRQLGAVRWSTVRFLRNVDRNSWDPHRW